jgi:hypothetical protein
VKPSRAFRAWSDLTVEVQVALDGIDVPPGSVRDRLAMLTTMHRVMREEIAESARWQRRVRLLERRLDAVRRTIDGRADVPEEE